MSSPETSTDKSRIGKIELDYLTRIEAAMQNPVQSSTVKMWLTQAAEKGLDPKELYARAVHSRPPHWMPAPPFSDVAPDKLIMMRKIPHISRVSTALRGPISSEEIRYDLTVAQADGFDPKDLYEKCVQAKALKGETKYPAPPYSDVDPNA